MQFILAAVYNTSPTACRYHLPGTLNHCHVLLHKNALVPWFILVPDVDCADLLALPAMQRNLTWNSN